MSMSVIKPLIYLNDAILILRDKIIELSDLRSDFVINSLSAYGPDLSKLLDDVQVSIKERNIDPEEKKNDTLVVFEVRNNADSNNNMFQQDVMYSGYVMHLIIYGESAEDVAKKLKSRLLLADNKYELRRNGVHISRISNIESENEFKNEVMWQRRDLDIYFAFRR